MTWWASRSKREKRLLQAAAGLGFLALGFQGVLVPLQAQREDARQRLAEATATQARLQRLQQAGIANAPVAPPSEPSATRARLLAWASELSLVENRPAQPAGALTFEFAAARPEAVFAWIERAERQAGLEVGSARIVSSGNGQVAASVVLTNGAMP